MKNHLKTKLAVCALASVLLLSSCGNTNDIYDEYSSKLASIKAEQSTDDYRTTSKTASTTAEPEEKDNIKNYDVMTIGKFHNGIAPVCLNVKDSTWYDYHYSYTYIDLKGNLLFPAQYYEVPEIMDGAAKVRTSNNYWQIVNDKGKILVSTDDDNVVSIGDVSEGLYWVLTVNETLAGNIYKTTYYNTSGEEEFSFENTTPGNYDYYYERGTFTEYGYAIICTNGVCKIIDTTGKVVYTGSGKSMSWKNIDNCVVSDNYENVYLDLYEPKTTKISFNPETHSEFSSANTIEWAVSESYNNEPRLVCVYLQNRDGVEFFSIADENGKVLMKPQKAISFVNIPYGTIDGIFNYYPLGTTINLFSEGLLAAKDVKTGLYGYIDSTGKWVVEPKYKMTTPFSDGYATVDYKTVINKKGEVVLKAD